MTILELKNILIHKISAINDTSFLNAIKTLLDTKSETTVYKTSPKQKLNINEGIEQLDKGEYFTNEQLASEMNTWLSEK